jgi:hypothetical protein
METALDVKRRHEKELLRIPGVIGVGIGRKGTRDCIVIFIDAAIQENRSALPQFLGDFEVEIVETDRFQAR